MKKRIPHAPSGLFLIELIISMFFFLIFLTISMQLLSHAYRTKENTAALTYGINTLTNGAELLKAANGDIKKLETYYPLGVYDNHTFSVYFSDQMTETTKDDWTYQMVISSVQTNNDILSSLDFYPRSKSNVSIYHIDLNLHLPLVTGGAINE